MPTQRKQKKRNSRGGRGFIFSSLSFIVICAALVFGMSVFFRVSNIEVAGAQRYTQDEIIAASGVKDGDNLMFVNRESAAQKIYSKLLYIGKVTVSRKLPNTIVITVSESGQAAVIETDSGLWVMDSNCRLLEECSSQEASSYIKVKGLSAVKPEKGGTLSVAEEDKPKAEYLSGILGALAARNMLADVSSVDISDTANAQFDYLGERFTVKLGANENLDYKFELLLGTVSKLDAGDTGAIDLSQNKKALFSPF